MNIKKIGIGIIVLGIIIATFGIQEIITAKFSNQDDSLSSNQEKESINNKIKHEINKPELFTIFKESYVTSGTRHILYGLLFIFSGVGLIKRKRWGVAIFLALWIIIFLFSIYLVSEGLSFKYMLFLPLVILILSFLYFNHGSVKNQLR